MIKTLFIWVSLLAGFVGHTQNNIKNYVRGNSVEIPTIDPDSTDYSDLTEIGNAIGESKIVMLGEQDHGDAPTFQAKTRIIKYLHEKKGFNVLAFESNFFGLNYDWKLVEERKMRIDTFLLNNIYSLWTQCDACKTLFYKYIPETFTSAFPLLITGFDNQMYSANIFIILDSVLRNAEITITKNKEYKSTILPLIKSWYKYAKDESPDTSNLIVDYLKEIKKQLISKYDLNNFWVIVVENLIQENIEFKNLGKDYWLSTNTRDNQMALNLKWLSEIKYPNDKIIVWAHNYHVSKYSDHYPEKFLNEAKTMGTVFTKDSTTLKNTYILGFTSYEGTAGRLNSKIYKVNKPEENSVENWIDKKYNFAFVDFKKYNLLYPDNNQAFFMSGAIKGSQYHKNQMAQWNYIFDGVFYIKKMYPCLR